MKKTLANIRTLAALLIASATLAACSNDDSAIIGEQPAQQQAPQVYTLTLQAGKADNAKTRALKLETNGDLTAYWADGDVVTVTKGDDELGTLSVKEGSVSADGQTCTFTGELTGTVSTGDDLTLTYHPVASLAAYASQTGTLASAAACDMATAEVTVAAVGDGNKITITETSVNFTTQTAMLKITMQDTGGNKINATKLQVSTAIGTTAIDIFSFSPTAATYTANGDGILYFALPSAATVAADMGITTDAFAVLPITFSATAGGETYTATKTGYPFAAGKYYATTLTKPAAAYTLLSAATTSDYGKVVCAAGHLHDAKTAVPAGCTAVGILGKVTDTGHGLILALQDATSQDWNTINGWTSVTSYANTTLKVLPDDAARGSLTSYTTLGATAVSDWAVAQMSDYDAIFTNLGSTIGDNDGKTYDGNVNDYITTGVGGTAISGNYWSATDYGNITAWYFRSNYWWHDNKTSSNRVRPVLAF